MKTAIIDVGSNSVRYAVMDGQTEIAQKELSGTVLADGLFFSGKLSQAAIERTVDAIAAFCDKAKRTRVEQIHIFATEAVRAASNGNQFTDAVFARVGVPVDVINGDTEARIGFLGATGGNKDSVAVFDMGGASCEIICGENGNIMFEKSAPIGCVRLRDGAGSDRKKAEDLIAQALPEALPVADKIIGIGGSATALGGMLHCPQKYDMHVTHNSVVPREFLCKVADLFFGGADMKALYPSLSPARARIIGYGALAALHVLSLLDKPSFTVSERDNVEGYWELLHNK